eukprot:COSAG06_NODE_40418_length_402_cov_0.775578_1_plen_57_part_10
MYPGLLGGEGVDRDADRPDEGTVAAESKRLVIEALWLVNGGHGASLRHHKVMTEGAG